MEDCLELHLVCFALNLGAAALQFYTSRSELFEKLLEFFPLNMKEPAGNLVDLVIL